MTDLPAVIQQRGNVDNTVRTGVVEAVNAGANTITVRVSGRSLPNILVLAGFVPAVGQVVALIRQQASWMAIGIAGTASTPLFRARRETTGQSIANNTFVALTWNAIDLDTHAGYDAGVSTSRYTIQEAGWYDLRAAVAFAAAGGGRRAQRWTRSGTPIPGSQTQFTPNAIGNNYPAATIMALFTVGQYVEFQVFQDSGAAVTTHVSSTENQSYMEARWLAAP